MAKRKKKQDGPTRPKKAQAQPEQPDPHELLFTHMQIEERVSDYIDHCGDTYSENMLKPLKDLRNYHFEQTSRIAVMLVGPMMAAKQQAVAPPPPEEENTPAENAQETESPEEENS
jgi:hypothetical protein